MVFIRYLCNFFCWRTELNYERNQEDSTSVCSMLQQLDSSFTLSLKIYFSLFPFPFFFFFLVFRKVELPWPRSVVFLKLIMSSQQFPNYTSAESCFAQELVPFNNSTSKPNIFNSTDSWLTFTAKSTMSFDSIPRASSPIAIATKTLSFRHFFSRRHLKKATPLSTRKETTN